MTVSRRMRGLPSFAALEALGSYSSIICRYTAQYPQLNKMEWPILRITWNSQQLHGNVPEPGTTSRISVTIWGR
eukprot:11976062-Karenia_brevis.AAC.1